MIPKLRQFFWVDYLPVRDADYYQQQDQAEEGTPMFAYQYRIMALCFQPKKFVKGRCDLIISIHLHDESQLAPRELALSVIEEQKTGLPLRCIRILRRAPETGFAF